MGELDIAGLRARLDRESAIGDVAQRPELPALSYREGYALLDRLEAAETERRKVEGALARRWQSSIRDRARAMAAETEVATLRTRLAAVEALADEWEREASLSDPYHALSFTFATEHLRRALGGADTGETGT